MIQEIIPIILALIGVWIGAKVALNPIDKLAQKLHHSSFLISFFILGLFTSLTEISVAVNSYIDNNIKISVGNLLGGSLVIFIFVIPLLGLLSGGLKLKNKFGASGIFLCISFLLLPHIFLLDKAITLNESFVLLAMYIVLAVYLYIQDGKNIKFAKKHNKVLTTQKKSVVFAFALITLGSVILIFSSNLLVEGVVKLGNIWNISPFVISLLGLSIGTNLPEISIAILAALKGESEIGLGNYLGSAVFNPLILSILGITSGGIQIDENFTKILIFSVLGFVLFFIFIKSKNVLSRFESLLLIFVFILFNISELI